MFTARKTKASVRTTICSAITSKRSIHFYYLGGFRLAEPYCYGALPDDNEALLCHQVSGHSELGEPTGWKLFRSSEISILTVTDKHFTGAIPEDDSGYDSRHSAFTTIFCQVSPDTTDESEPTESTKLEHGNEEERTDDENRRKHIARVENHFERMKRFRFLHFIFPLKNRFRAK